MKKQTRRSAVYLAQAGVIAALYTALTYASGFFGLAYGPVQFRVSELLALLPVFTPAAVPGLVVGCILSNIGSTVGAVDVVFGTLATLSAAVCTRALRNVRLGKLPVLSTLPPVIFNGLIVGFEIWLMGDRTAALFAASALSVAAGEFCVCVVLGIPFILLVQRTGIFEKFRPD